MCFSIDYQIIRSINYNLRRFIVVGRSDFIFAINCVVFDRDLKKYLNLRNYISITFLNTVYISRAMRNIPIFLAIVLNMLLTFQDSFCQGVSDKKITIVAHRGGIVPGIPENTESAFRNSIGLNVEFIEVDLRTSSDGEIVIFHDETLERTTNGHGKLSHHTLADLKELDAGNGEKILTYKELLEICKNSQVNILLDIKDIKGDSYKRLVNQTGNYEMISRILIGARTLEDLSRFKAIDPDLKFLGFIPDTDSIVRFINEGAQVIRLWPDWIRADKRLVDLIHQNDVDVWTTAGNSPNVELLSLIEAGVDGIIVDDPGRLQKLIEEQ